MSDSSKKRSTSFRRLIPRIFLSNKSKQKDANKEAHYLDKYEFEHDKFSSNSDYENIKVVKSTINKIEPEEFEQIYESPQLERNEFGGESSTISKYSSNGTALCSNDVDIKENKSSDKLEAEYIKIKHYHTARPQVPRKPSKKLKECKSKLSSELLTKNDQFYPLKYADTYSLEDMTDHISSPENLEVVNILPKNNMKPQSVGTEIQSYNTKFVITPKEKETRVKSTHQALKKSLSLENTEWLDRKYINSKKEELNKKKSYVDSDSTSSLAYKNKLRNKPVSFSTDKYVKEMVNDVEEKRISPNRFENRHHSLPFQFNEKQNKCGHNPLHILESTESNSHDNNAELKERAKQEIEAFYWQMLQKMKIKEDEYISNSLVYTPELTKNRMSRNTKIHNNCSPIEARSLSLPRRKTPNYFNYRNDIATRSNKSMSIGSKHNNMNNDNEIVYRHPDKVVSSKSYRTNEMKTTVDVANRVSKRVNINGNNFILRDGEILKLSKTQSPAPTPPRRTSSVKHHLTTPIDEIYLVPDMKYSESGSSLKRGKKSMLMVLQHKEEDWHGDGSRMDGGLSDGEAGRAPSRGRSSRRDDPRRHTLAGNHLYMHPHHPGQLNALDMEPPLPRSYQQPTNALLFDDDPGIMSEVETASTGFRRGGKQRSSLPVVRTPSKTLERPLGLVFLQYRNETKRALLPNEITSIDTVKALFVRSFPKQLTMQYMDSPMVKIYIHDSSKDMFYELEDVRAHLRDIRDRSVLRLFEASDIGGGAFPGAVGVGSLAMPPGAATCSGPSSWDQDQSYFSEPEIDSEYHHQHVHKSKVKAPAYYMGTPAPSTLPRGGSLLRAFSPAAPPVAADRVKSLPGAGPTAPSKPLRAFPPRGGSDRGYSFNIPECLTLRGSDHLYTIPVHAEGYMSSPERGAPRVPYEDPYYSQFLGPATGRPTIAPVIDEEASDGAILEDTYQMYGVTTGMPPNRSMTHVQYENRQDDMQRLRVEKMERQLANLTGLVHKALQVPGTPAAAPRQEFQPTYQSRTSAQDAARFASTDRPPKLGKDKFQKSVSFEKSVSFSDDPPDASSPKQHSPQHSAESKPTKPAIKSSTLPRTSSQERDRLKPAPPPKPAGLGPQLPVAPQKVYTINVPADFLNRLYMLQKQARDLRIETRNLRRSTLAHAIQIRQMLAETIMKIGDITASINDANTDAITREEEVYRHDMLLLESDLYDLEATVERLRGQAANKETRVNMSDIETIAMILSKSSKTVADWKMRFPILQDTMKSKLSSEIEKAVKKEKMLEEEPERLELALRRCKKLTGTLVTLKRLACVQEQRLPCSDGRSSPDSQNSGFCQSAADIEEFPTDNGNCNMPAVHPKLAWRQSQYFKEAIILNELLGTARSAWDGGQGTGICTGRGGAGRGDGDVPRSENALDALLDELQTFAKPPAERAREDGSLRRLHSYPSGSDTDASPPVRARGQHPPKPPVPERHPELLAMAARRAPPPPPPRTTSKSPLASPPSPASPPRNGSDSLDFQNKNMSNSRQALLEQRHQELLKKQKALQQQYVRLQMIQRSGTVLPGGNNQPDLKKTGSESNLLARMNFNLAASSISGSLTHLAIDSDKQTINNTQDTLQKYNEPLAIVEDGDDKNKMNIISDDVATTNKVYETDIL